MTSEKLAPGLRGRRDTMVCEHNVAAHVDRYSTPSMIALMEAAAQAAIQDLLGPGETSVGFEVNIRHVAPSLIGARITANAEITEVKGNRLTFKVDAYDGERVIGEGTHRRAIITLDSVSSERSANPDGPPGRVYYREPMVRP